MKTYICSHIIGFKINQIIKEVVTSYSLLHKAQLGNCITMSYQYAPSYMHIQIDSTKSSQSHIQTATNLQTLKYAAKWIKSSPLANKNKSVSQKFAVPAHSRQIYLPRHYKAQCPETNHCLHRWQFRFRGTMYKPYFLHLKSRITRNDVSLYITKAYYIVIQQIEEEKKLQTMTQ